MLPKRHRLTRSSDFARVRRLGRSSGSRLVVVYRLPNHSEKIRVGFSVSKRVGKSTVRNKVKRRMREAVREQLPGLGAGQDLIVIARPACADATYQQISSAVENVLLKTGATRALLGSA